MGVLQTFCGAMPARPAQNLLPGLLIFLKIASDGKNKGQ